MMARKYMAPNPLCGKMDHLFTEMSSQILAAHGETQRRFGALIP